MILIGQYDSPFVRSVGIVLTLHGMEFEHRPWSVFGDTDKIVIYSPARRVPILVLDDGEAVIETLIILDAVNQMAGDKALVPALGPGRRQVLKVCALASSLADKAVALVYERVLHQVTSQTWIDRCRGQVGDLLGALNADRADRSTAWWFGEDLSQADIMVACASRFLAEAHPDVFDLADWPALKSHSERCEAQPAFQAIQQPFHITPPKT